MNGISSIGPNPIFATDIITPGHETNSISSFKDILLKKRQAIKTAPIPESETKTTTLTHVVKDMMDNHEQATKSIKSFMTRTDYSVEKLLAMQYKTGLLFLREQMFCKTAELSASTFKNFTQMQI